VVEQVDSSYALVVYSVGALGTPDSTWQRVWMQVLPEGKLLFSIGSIRFTFTMNADLNSIGGLREGANTTSTITLTRCSVG
jgi:hypothetical protein